MQTKGVIFGAETIPNRHRTRATSVSNSASPQRMTSLFTRASHTPTLRPPPTPSTHEDPPARGDPPPARDVNKARSGAISPSICANDPTSHTSSGHIQRCLRHHSRTGRPNTGRTHQPNQPIAFGPPPSHHTPRAPAGVHKTGSSPLSRPPRTSSTPTRSTSPARPAPQEMLVATLRTVGKETWDKKGAR